MPLQMDRVIIEALFPLCFLCVMISNNKNAKIQIILFVLIEKNITYRKTFTVILSFTIQSSEMLN